MISNPNNEEAFRGITDFDRLKPGTLIEHAYTQSLGVSFDVHGGCCDRYLDPGVPVVFLGLGMRGEGMIQILLPTGEVCYRYTHDLICWYRSRRPHG